MKRTKSGINVMVSHTLQEMYTKNRQFNWKQDILFSPASCLREMGKIRGKCTELIPVSYFQDQFVREVTLKILPNNE